MEVVYSEPLPLIINYSPYFDIFSVPQKIKNFNLFG